ncbi:MAG: glycosyltransferase, partial [Pirellulales bacterium]|nr:glycosyltransferase [Pirellulales bacterium]
MSAISQAVVATPMVTDASGQQAHVPKGVSRATLSAVLIVKNEAHVLEPCLESLAGWVDEIVVLDSGSTDGTPELAAQYGAKVHVREDWDGFG